MKNKMIVVKTIIIPLIVDIFILAAPNQIFASSNRSSTSIDSYWGYILGAVVVVVVGVIIYFRITKVSRLIKKLSYQTNIVHHMLEALTTLGVTKEQVFQGYIKALKAKDVRVRRYAVIALGEIGDERAVVSLIEVLKNENEQSVIRENAAVALGKIGDKSAIFVLIEALKDKSYDVCQAACKALSCIGSPAVPDLIKALKNENGSVRSYAAESLGNIGDKSAIPALIEAIKSSKFWDDSKDAADALGQMGINAKEAIPDLIKIMLEDKFLNVRHDAAEALGNIGDKSAVPALITALKDESDYIGTVREAAAEALGKIAEPVTVEPLIKCLGDDSCRVRIAAAEALGKMGPAAKKAVPALAHASEDGAKDAPGYYHFDEVVFSAWFAITQIPPSKEAIPTLVKILGYGIKLWLGNVDEMEKIRIGAANALRALGKMGSAAKEAVPTFIKAWKDYKKAEDMSKDSIYTRAIVIIMDVLKEITGQDFGNDHTKWQEWWEQNKENARNSR